MRYSAVLCLALIFLLPSTSIAGPLLNCLKTETGKIVVKRRCKVKKGEQEISAETLQGLGASQVGPKGEKGPSGTANISAIESFDNVLLDGGASGAFDKFFDIGIFSKQKPNSVVKISVYTHATLTTDSSFAHFCNIEVRIDDADPEGTIGDFDYKTAAGANIRTLIHSTTIDTPLSMQGVFRDLSAGEHVVSLHARVSAGDTCRLNNGGYRVTAVVEEIVT